MRRAEKTSTKRSCCLWLSWNPDGELPRWRVEPIMTATDLRIRRGIRRAGTYYNYFGIGAVDSDAVAGGIRTAVKNGWSSPASAIAGGASWISSGYIYAAEYPQETLYEMRWDLDRSEATRTRGWHQYSTSLTWDVSIAVGQMAACYRIAGYSKPNLSYIVPQYRW